ncbi:MAG: AI-2E family transporter [Myxococcales bacterium]|jgi:predicted PurR-regulated permease PerM
MGEGFPPPTTRWPRYRYIVGAGLTLFVLWGTFILLSRAVEVLFLTLFGILLAFVLHYPVKWLGRLMPRPLAAIIVVLGSLGLVALLAWLAYPSLAAQVEQLVQQAPEAFARVQRWWTRAQAEVGAAPGPLGGVGERIGERLGAWLGRIAPTAVGGLFAVLAGIVFVIAVAFFLAYEPEVYVRGIVHLVPYEQQDNLRAYFLKVGTAIKGWVVGTLISMTAVGVLTAIGLLIIGLDTWLVLSVIAFFGELVPYAGPFLAAVPGVAAGLTQGFATGLWTLVVYIAVQQIEGNLLMPIVMKHAVDIPPALLLFWQILLTLSLGPLAIFIATPLLAVILVTLEHFYVHKTLGKTPEAAAKGLRDDIL